MRTVKNPDFSFFVTVDAVCPDNIDAGFSVRQFVFKITFNYPEMKYLGSVDQSVAGTNFLQLLFFVFIFRITCTYPVDKRTAKTVFTEHPVSELFPELP